MAGADILVGVSKERASRVQARLVVGPLSLHGEETESGIPTGRALFVGPLPVVRAFVHYTELRSPHTVHTDEAIREPF